MSPHAFHFAFGSVYALPPEGAAAPEARQSRFLGPSW
jgi:hypothetical protein